MAQKFPLLRPFGRDFNSAHYKPPFILFVLRPYFYRWSASRFPVGNSPVTFATISLKNINPAKDKEILSLLNRFPSPAAPSNGGLEIPDYSQDRPYDLLRVAAGALHPSKQ